MISSKYISKDGSISYRVVDYNDDPIVYINSRHRKINAVSAAELSELLAQVTDKWARGEKVHVS